MTVSTLNSVAEFVTNGVTTNFPFYFKFLANEDLVVTYVSPPPLNTVTVLILGTNYTVNGAGNDSGGSIVTNTALAGPGQLVVSREMDAYQQTSLRNQGKFLAETHEDVFDRLTMLIQQGVSIFTRALTRPLGRDYFYAENRRITSVADPTEPQDAATKHSVEAYVTEIMESGQGPENNAQNVIYARPGFPALSVADELTRINVDLAELDGVEKNYLYQDVSISAGAISLDVSNYTNFGVLLTSNITSVTLSGAVAGKIYEVNLFAVQDMFGDRSITFPASVRLPYGETSILATRPNSTSLIQLITRDAGVTWLARKVRDYQTIPEFQLPALVGDNATFNDEGTSTAGWTATNVTLSTPDPTRVRLTKTSSVANGQVTRTVTFPASNKDWQVFWKGRTDPTAAGISALTFKNGTQTVFVAIGTPDGGTTNTPGTVSIGQANGGSFTAASAGTGINYTSQDLDLMVHFDSTYNTANLYFRESSGKWAFKARVSRAYMTPTSLEMTLSATAPIGSVLEFDFVTVAAPNLIALGDSIAAGATLFDPNPALALTNYDSTWQRNAPVYPAVRNNFIANKGVNGNTSAQMLARITDATKHGAKVVFLHASTNDYAAGVTQATHKTNTQAIINAVAASGAATVLLNQIYGNPSTPANLPTPGMRDYGLAAWTVPNLLSLTGVSAFIDIMRPIKDANNFISTANTQPDGHPNVAGYTAIGAYIAGS